MKIPIERAMERYPLQVYFPQPGEYHLLIIHTDERQQEFLLAKTASKLKLLYNVAMKRLHYPPTARAHWKVEMVAPPRELQELYATKRYEWDLGYFHISMSHEVERLLKRNFKISGARLCKTYEVVEDGYQDAEFHSDCKNCNGRQVLFDVDIEDLYEKKADLIEKLKNVGRPPAFRFNKVKKSKEVRPHPVFSIAGRRSSPGRTLYMARADHGHHAKGNVIEKITNDMIHAMANNNEAPLFFFHGKMLSKQPAWAKKLEKDFYARRKEAEKNRGKLAAERQNREDKERDRLLKEIFS